MTLEVTVPANTTAIVELPLRINKATTAIESFITESGKPLKDSPNVKILETKDFTSVKIQIDAGKYRFEMPWK